VAFLGIRGLGATLLALAAGKNNTYSHRRRFLGSQFTENAFWCIKRLTVTDHMCMLILHADRTKH